MEKERLDKAILSLYDSSSTVSDLRGSFALLTEDVTFDNPMIHVQGREKYIAIFEWMRPFVNTISPRLISSNLDRNVYTANMIVSYNFFRLLPTLSIHQVVVCKLGEINNRPLCLTRDSLKQIISHQDAWSFASLIETVPIVSSFYSWSRRIAGYASSSILLAISPIAPVPDLSREPPQGIIISCELIKGYFINKRGFALYTK